MRGIRLSNLLLYGIGLLLLVAASALPSRAQTETCYTTASPTNVYFAPQPVGTTSAVQTVTFSTTCAGVTLLNFAVGGADSGDFSATGPPCTIPPCAVSVTFTPAIQGPRSATLSFTYNQGGANFTVTVNLGGADEIVFVSTQSGSQILQVHGTTGQFTVIYDAFDSDTPFSPEGMTVGPDGNLYITDPSYGNVWQLNPISGGLVLVASFGTDGDPVPQGPSFSGSPTGDLYFNTRNGGVYEIPSAATTSGGGFQAPVEIVPNASCDCSLPGGSGTAFDGNGNLLFDEIFGPGDNAELFSMPAPYTGSPSVTEDGLTGPIGIAIDKATTNMYVANTGLAQIVQSNGNVYYTFPTSAPCGDFSNADEPMFLQSDAFGSFYVVTTRDGVADCGKLWRIDPPAAAGVPPTAVLLLDLNNAPAGSPTLHTNQAVGVAVPPTQGQTQGPYDLSATGGTFTAGVPTNCGPLTVPCSSTYGVQYPAGMFTHGETVSVIFNETTEEKYSALVAASNYSLTKCAPVTGYGGDCLIPTAVVNCPSGQTCTTTKGLSYQVSTTWLTDQTNYCSLIPHLLRADAADGPVTGVPYTSVIDTINPASCTETGDPAAGTKGQSSCTSSTSSSGCLSDWPNSTGKTTQNATIAATATITSPPTPPATFLLNQPETATFACAPSSIVVSCPGVVTQPDGTIVSVATGGTLPTSEAGTYTLSVTAEVDGGLPASAMAQYTVVPCQNVGFAFNPDTVVVGKSTTVTATFQSCNSKTELATLQFTLTGPLGKSCGTETTPVLSLVAILASKPLSFNFPLKIPSGACAGTYTVTANTVVKGTVVDTSSSSLAVIQ